MTNCVTKKIMLTPPAYVDAYIQGFSSPVRERLEALRDLIRTLAPDATEGIAYGMPAWKLHKKPLVYFAGFDHHVGFYALPSGHAAFDAALQSYKRGKGSVQFPHDRPLPLDLIADIVRFRIHENSSRT